MRMPKYIDGDAGDAVDASMSEVFRNRLLAALSAEAYGHLAPHLCRLALAQDAVLYEEGEPLTKASLPETAIISFVTRMQDGSSVETASVGCEGAIGFVGSLATTVALRRSTVQLPGEAFVIDVNRVREAAARSAELRDVAMWYSAVFIANMHQLVACNARHSIEQRLARGLLQFCDRAESTRLPLKQEFLARMLGVQRPSVSLAANALQRRGVITYRRGKLEIRNATALKDATCECYQKMRRAELDLPPVRSIKSSKKPD